MSLADIIAHLALFPTPLTLLGSSHQDMGTSRRFIRWFDAFGIVMDLGLELVETIHERQVAGLLPTVGTSVRKMMLCLFHNLEGLEDTLIVKDMRAPQGFTALPRQDISTYSTILVRFIFTHLNR